MDSIIKRREYFALLFAGIISIGICQAQWIIEKCPSKNNLKGISFTDLNTGWIVGEKGTILNYSGTGWKEYQGITGQNLNSVLMLDKDNGWAVGDNGTIIHYNGEYWKSYDSPTKNDLFSVSFQNPEKGVAVGDFGTVLIYNNGKWNLSESGIRGNLYSTFYRKDEAWIGGGLECIDVPLIKIGINSKGNLPINSYNLNATIKSLVFINPNDGWAVGSPSILLHYDGNKWDKDSNDDNYSSLNSVFFSDENNGISVGFGGTVLTFTNHLWTNEIIVTDQNLNGASIIKNRYFAVGDSGTIISMDAAFESLKTDKSNNNKEKIRIYPNPCDEFLNIVFPSVYEDSKASLSVYNLLGEIIMQKELRLGNRSTTSPLITKELKNGLYMIRITLGDKTTIYEFVIRH